MWDLRVKLERKIVIKFSLPNYCFQDVAGGFGNKFDKVFIRMYSALVW